MVHLEGKIDTKFVFDELALIENIRLPIGNS